LEFALESDSASGLKLMINRADVISLFATGKTIEERRAISRNPQVKETQYKTFGDVAELQKRHQQEMQELAQRQQAERKSAEDELMAYHRNGKNEAALIAARTSNAYSADAYPDGEWEKCAALLLDRGFDATATETILRSKWTRWARDAADSEIGTAQMLADFLDKHGGGECDQWSSLA
jgi:hypothetical protein